VAKLYCSFSLHLYFKSTVGSRSNMVRAGSRSEAAAALSFQTTDVLDDGALYQKQIDGIVAMDQSPNAPEASRSQHHRTHIGAWFFGRHGWQVHDDDQSTLFATSTSWSTVGLHRDATV
jgi:hypothetical protein